jgi:hypothetical protein
MLLGAILAPRSEFGSKRAQIIASGADLGPKQFVKHRMGNHFVKTTLVRTPTEVPVLHLDSLVCKT